MKLIYGLLTYSLCQDFGKRLERDIKKFVNTRLDATKQLTGQEVDKHVENQNPFSYFEFSAKANRCLGDSASDAEIRCVVRRQHAGIDGNI